MVSDSPKSNTQTRISGVSDIIDNRPISRFQVRTILLGGLVLFADGFDTQTIGFLAPSIAESTNIPVETFGWIFSAGLVGFMVAAMLAGPIADRWGRKWPIVISVLSLAVFSILTALSTSYMELLIFRFCTGLGLGGALPNVVALAAEYTPKRLMPVIVSILFSGLPLGGFVCGMISSTLLTSWGWQSVFYIGGFFPLTLAIFLMALLPESVRFLYQRGGDPQKISKLLTPIAPEIAAARDSFSLAPPVSEPAGAPIKQLFTNNRAAGTVLLWIPNFMNLLLMYVIVNWLPALLQAAGMSKTDGITATAFFSLGGILGTFTEGFLIKFGGPYRILLVEFGLCGLLTAWMAMSADSWMLVIVLTFLLGFLVVGAQAGLNVLAAHFYPTFIRSTGVGWALGIGRIGSIIGPLLVTMLLSLQWQAWQVLLAGAIPALTAFFAISLSRRVRSDDSPYAGV